MASDFSGSPERRRIHDAGPSSSRGIGLEADDEDDRSRDENGSDTIHLVDNSLHETSGTFQKLRTAPVAFAQLFLCLAVCVLSFVIPVLCHSFHDQPRCLVRPESLIACIHVAVWFLTWLLHILQNVQHENHKLNHGYFAIHKTTEMYRLYPHKLLSLGNGALLLFMSLLYDSCSPSQSKNGDPSPHPLLCLGAGGGAGGLHSWAYLSILISIEIVPCLILLSLYIFHVMQFNARRPPPDILGDVRTVSSFAAAQQTGLELGLADISSSQVTERMVEVIVALREHNTRLGRKVLGLSNQLQTLQKYAERI